MTANAETQAISQEYDLPFPPAKVWRALTEPELLGQWLMATDMQPVVGQSFTFRDKPMPWWDGIVRCEVLKIEPNMLVSYTWRSGPESSPLDTIVTWTLAPTASGGTRLTLEHSGFVPANEFAFEGAKKGWQEKVGRLAEVLAKAA